MTNMQRQSEQNHPFPAPASPVAARAIALEERVRELEAAITYLGAEDAEHIRAAFALAREALAVASAGDRQLVERQLADAAETATILADNLRIDATTLVAVLLTPAVERHALDTRNLQTALPQDMIERALRLISSIERFDALQRPRAALRRSARATPTESEQAARGRPRNRERQRQQDEDALRKMFLAVADDPRVVVIKIADQLRQMRVSLSAAARLRAGTPESAASMIDADAGSSEDIHARAEETRALYAPLASRLGMGRVDAELEDLAFAILEPEDYHWLAEAVAEETSERRSYVDRVCEALREEMRKIGIRAEISGRVKHLYSIYRKVVRAGDRDLSHLYDILAFRIITQKESDCYRALGHVHNLWRPVEGRIKDFIANPKANGYKSLHTTVFCLDNRLAEIQIRTRAMHETAEYGVAMHWYYKEAGDTARADARSLQTWMQQVMDWRQELKQSPPTRDDATPATPSAALQEHIFVLTPRGDVKEMPPGSTPLDFAYRVHSDLGNHIGGVRITQDNGSGRTVRRLVPLDYELKNGDIVELIKRNDAHPTRDWLRIVTTKLARQRIQQYLKAHERDIDIQVGRERLDRELRQAGVRKGWEDLTEEDIRWIVEQLGLPDEDTMLAQVGADKLRPNAVIVKARERLKLPAQVEESALQEPPPITPSREGQIEVSVQGLAGILTELANCCNPLPGDPLYGYISRGRGVVIHRENCPNLLRLMKQSPERGIAVAWPALGGQELFRAPITVEGSDRQGFMRDVTGAIADSKLTMVKVDVSTNRRTRKAIINAVLEIRRPEELESVLRAIRTVPGVLSAGRRAPGGGHLSA
ncbi:MAG TPA: HD domain-containing protein [Ktedonobacterales bacterium]